MPRTLGIALAVLALCGGLAAFFLLRRDGRPPAEPPVVLDTLGIQPYVLRVVEDALADVRAAPRDARRWRALGMAYQANFIDLAGRCYEEALLLDPKDAKSWYYLARARAETGDLAGAVEAVDRALAIEEPIAHAHWSRGAWLLELGRTDEAEAAFRRALDLAPGAIAAEVGLGRALLQKGEAEAAVAILEGVRRRIPDAPEAAYVANQLAAAYQALGRADEALALRTGEAVQRPVWEDPWIRETNEKRAIRSWVLQDADLAVREGRVAWALEKLRALAEAEPEDGETRLALGRALYAAGRPDEALAELERAAARLADPYEVHLNLSVAYVQSGRAEKALLHAHEAARLRPDDATAELHLGRALLASQDLERAAEAFRRSIALGNLEPHPRVWLGQALCGLERWDEALAVLEPVARASPGIAQAQLWLARASAEEGRLDAAVLALERARELAPRDPALAAVERRIEELARGAGNGR